jgi:uncharacterized damage-inducible protein DinB
MPATLAHYAHLLAYDTWANERAIASLESIPQASRTGDVYARAMGLVPHVLLARRVWLWRIRGEAYERVPDWFPMTSAAETRAMATEVDAAWQGFLAGLTLADLDREVGYTASSGDSFVSTIGEILDHVFNHGTYHRGQIARLVTELGGSRAETDLIGMTRRPRR